MDKKFVIILCGVLFLLGTGLGILIGINIESPILEDIIAVKKVEDSKTLKDVISKQEIESLKNKVIEDENGYSNYQKLKSYGFYKEEPDRIYFKSSKADGFYLFENDDENYKHLLEVVEDRMYYSAMEDYNLYCFTPDSIETMMTSGDNYIILDYDNGDLEKTDSNYNINIIFRFIEKTRLYRLVTCLSYDREMILKENLGKKEFADNTKVSGYKYFYEDDYSE